MPPPFEGATDLKTRLQGRFEFDPVRSAGLCERVARRHSRMVGCRLPVGLDGTPAFHDHLAAPPGDRVATVVYR